MQSFPYPKKKMASYSYLVYYEGFIDDLDAIQLGDMITNIVS